MATKTTKAKERLWGQTPASQERRVKLMLAAKEVFFDDGYQLASMEKIAEVAGASKRTLYDHFGSKETLFIDAIEYGCRNFIDSLPSIEDLPEDPAQGLYVFATKVRDMISDAESVRFQRIVIAEAERWPDVAASMNRAADEADDRLSDYIESRISAGRLAVHDVRVSSRIIIDTATNSSRLRMLLRSGNAASDRLGDKALKAVIAMIVTAHASKRAAKAS